MKHIIVVDLLNWRQDKRDKQEKTGGDRYGYYIK